jgi:hypothetical protein
MYEEIEKIIKELNEINSVKANKYRKEFLLIQAKRRYPIGTVIDNSNIVPSTKKFIIDTEEFFLVDPNTIRHKSLTEGHWTVYKNGKWAEIVSKSEKEVNTKFEVGEWYRCSCNGNYYRFVEIKDNRFFVNDAQINPTNNKQQDSVKPGYQEKFKEKSLLEYFTDYNPVPLSEIQKYLPKSKSLAGRYAKCLKTNYLWTKDNYYQIKEGTKWKPNGVLIKDNDSSCWLVDSFKDFELMPEGFTPENIVPEYVECVKAYGYAKIGEIFDTKDDNIASKLFSLSWKSVLIEFKHLDHNFKPSSKKAYEAQQGIKVIEEKIEVLVQTNMNQGEACNTCKYNNRCFDAPHKDVEECCHANNGQHYPKEIVEEKWIPKVGDWVYAPTDSFKQALDYSPLNVLNEIKKRGWQEVKVPNTTLEEENILPSLKIKKKKLLLSSVPEVISVTSKLITNNKKVKL